MTRLIHNAMAIASGLVGEPDDLEDALEEARELAQEDDASDPDPEDEPIRLTPLDPQRPARGLLEDLLTGIWGCRLLYAEYVDPPAAEGGDAEDEEALYEGFDDMIDEQFSSLVRARAAADRDRLL